MNTKHLSDEQIQQFALHPLGCDAKFVVHINSCEACKAKVAVYQTLFTGIKAQVPPAFDFNLSNAILRQLPLKRKKISYEGFFIYTFLFISSLLVGATLFIFRENLINFFAGIPPLIIYLLFTTAFTIIIAVSVDMFKTYQRKIAALNVFELQH